MEIQTTRSQPLTALLKNGLASGGGPEGFLTLLSMASEMYSVPSVHIICHTYPAGAAGMYFQVVVLFSLLCVEIRISSVASSGAARPTLRLPHFLTYPVQPLNRLEVPMRPSSRAAIRSTVHASINHSPLLGELPDKATGHKPKQVRDGP